MDYSNIMTVADALAERSCPWSCMQCSWDRVQFLWNGVRESGAVLLDASRPSDLFGKRRAGCFQHANCA